MSYVYFITPEAAFVRDEPTLKVVKIGVTSGRPRNRVRALQCGSPVPLEIDEYLKSAEPSHIINYCRHRKDWRVLS